MSNDPSSPSSSVAREADGFLDTGQVEDNEAGHDVTSSHETQQRVRKVKLHEKRAQLLDHLIRNLDVVVYCELSAVYYMDCLFLPLILRAMTQFYFLSPKPMYVPSIPKPIPYVGAIFGTNVLCAILHISLARPEASEVVRGYLHGGLLIDFVGQRGPTSKLHLVFLDAVVLLLQLLTLAAHVERQAMKTGSRSTLSMGRRVSTVRSSAMASAVQDHDSEEQGVRRASLFQREDSPVHETGLSNRRSSAPHPPANIDVSSERPSIEAEPSSPTATEHGLSGFSFGEVVFADLHLLETIRSQWWAHGNARSRAV